MRTPYLWARSAGTPLPRVRPRRALPYLGGTDRLSDGVLQRATVLLGANLEGTVRRAHTVAARGCGLVVVRRFDGVKAAGTRRRFRTAGAV